MNEIKVTAEYGIIIRRSALLERNIILEDVLDVMRVTEPLDMNESLISFGPSFGKEALDELIAILQKKGLQYFEDFFEFVGDYPHWCAFQVHYVRDEGKQV